MGPTDSDTLAAEVGAAYWEPGRFDAALEAALRTQHVIRDAEGRLAAA